VPALEIPETIGAILLPDCTLFPQGALPLHIFEPRYREMLDDALEGNCFICVGRLTAEETFDFAECTAPIGTAGLIRASRELPDGRSHLILHGVYRVRFCEWLPERTYPFARIEPIQSIPLPTDACPEQSRRLRDAVDKVLLGFPEKVVSQVNGLLDRTSDAAMMADAIAQQFVHDPDLRQALLEEADVGVRVDQVIDHLRTLRIGEL
jgi:Lon protease-like protein